MGLDNHGRCHGGTFRLIVGPVRDQVFPPVNRARLMLRILATQRFFLDCVPVDRNNNPTKLDGNPAWSVSDPSKLDLIVGENLYSVELRAKGVIGTVQVSVHGDADLGPGVRDLVGTLDVEILPGEAASFNLNPRDVAEIPT